MYEITNETNNNSTTPKTMCFALRCYDLLFVIFYILYTVTSS